MHPYLLGLISSSSDGGGGLFFSHRSSPIVHGLWGCQDSRRRRATPVAASMINGKRDHYAILDVSRSASTAEIKRAYRLLARKYHPDVSQDARADEAFKSIHHAYEVLSNDITRAQYDNELKIKEVTERSSWRNSVYDPEIDDMRTFRWSELRYQMKYKRRKAKASRARNQPDTYEETSNNERGSFSEVMWFASLTLFFLHVIGYRLTLALCSLASLLDSQLDAGYKMGYVMACCLGGQGGVLLALCISFASWLCGKNSSGLVALTVLALWVAVNLSMFAPLPQGAVIALLYMSLKFEID